MRAVVLGEFEREHALFDAVRALLPSLAHDRPFAPPRAPSR